jgi:hypothetical protein
LRTIPLVLATLLLASLLAPIGLPVASATIGDVTSGDPSCAGSPSSGTRFTGVYENPDGMLIMAGGESWCDHNGTSSEHGTGVFVTAYTSRGPVDAWWESDNGSCTMGWQTPRGVDARACPAGLAPPDPGWGTLLLGQSVDL